VRVYTAHLCAGAAPELVREGFAWGALFFGPLWLWAHRAWIAGVLALCGYVLIAALPGLPERWLFGLVLAWALGLWGNDLRRWSLARRGYLLAHVLAAGNRDAALARLLARRPDLIGPAIA
jgi:hypothetical protein